LEKKVWNDHNTDNRLSKTKPCNANNNVDIITNILLNFVVKRKFSFPIEGLHNVIKQENSAIHIDGTTFHYWGDIGRVGTVTVENNVTFEEAVQESKY
jgi:hypothetical protein